MSCRGQKAHIIIKSSGLPPFFDFVNYLFIFLFLVLYLFIWMIINFSIYLFISYLLVFLS